MKMAITAGIGIAVVPKDVVPNEGDNYASLI